MKKKKLTLKELSIRSFLTATKEDQLHQIIGKSGCCLNMTGGGENNCYTGPHMGACNSTGSGDDQTGNGW